MYCRSIGYGTWGWARGPKINIFWPKMVKIHKLMIGMNWDHGYFLSWWESTFLVFAEAICIWQRLYDHLWQRLYAFCRGYMQKLQRLYAFCRGYMPLCRGYMQFLWEYRPTQSSWSWSWDWAWQLTKCTDSNKISNYMLLRGMHLSYSLHSNVTCQI